LRPRDCQNQRAEAVAAVHDSGLASNQFALMMIVKEATPEAQVAKAKEIAATKAALKPKPTLVPEADRHESIVPLMSMYLLLSKEAQAAFRVWLDS